MSAAVSDDLSRTRALFEHWRATRSGREKIPEELWQAVIAYAGTPFSRKVTARQRIPFLRRTGKTAADLRFIGAGADRTAVSKVAEAHSPAVAPGGSAGRL